MCAARVPTGLYHARDLMLGERAVKVALLSPLCLKRTSSLFFLAYNTLRPSSPRFAYNALRDKEPLHVTQYIIRILCI